MKYLIEARKAVVAVLAAAGELVNLGLVHGTAQHWISTILTVAGAAGVYVVPNGKRA